METNQKNKMRKIILLPFIALVVASCGPSEEELANAKKQCLQSIDSMMAIYETQVADYCKCLETGTTDECQNKHKTAHATWMYLMKQTDESYKYMVMPDESKKIREKYSEIMDRGAYCAKDAIANTVMRSDGTTYRAKSVATDDITPAAESSTKTETPSPDNNSKTTSTKKSTEKTKVKEEEEHHSEEKSGDPY